MKINKLDIVVLFGLVSILVGIIFSVSTKSIVKFNRQEIDFIETEIRGTLIDVKKRDRGIYSLVIRRYVTKDTLEYNLFLSAFMAENNIQANDSISKEANGHNIFFFKKTDGDFHKCCELYYH